MYGGWRDARKRRVEYGTAFRFARAMARAMAVLDARSP